MNWKFLQQSFAFLKKSLYLCTEIMKSPSLYDEAQERRMNIPTTWFFWYRASFLLRSNIPQPVHPHFGIRAAGKTLTSCPSTPYRRLRNPRYTHYLNCHIQKQAPTPHLRTPNIQCEEKSVIFCDIPCEDNSIIRDIPRHSVWRNNSIIREKKNPRDLPRDSVWLKVLIR